MSIGSMEFDNIFFGLIGKTLKDYYIFYSISMEELIGRYGFLTFRAHICEPDVFQDYLNFFLTIISKFNQYVYHVEKEGTPDQHIHAFFKLPDTINEKAKIKQKFEPKVVKDFQKSLKHKQTIWNHAVDYQLVADTIEDKLKTLGYCIKEDSKQSKHVGFSPTLLRQAIEFYVSTARIKDSSNGKDIKIVTSKNFHILLEDFAQKNNMTVHDYDIVYKMTEARHSFQISDRDLKKYHSEVKIMNQYEGYDNIEEKATILKYQEDYQYKELQEEIQWLKDKVKAREQLLIDKGINFGKLQM